MITANFMGQCTTKDWQGIVTPTGDRGEHHKDVCGILKVSPIHNSRTKPQCSSK